MMEEKYYNLINSFKELELNEKKEEIYKNIRELLYLLYLVNNKIIDDNKMLPVINNYSDDNEFYDVLFSSIISLKEENAKLIEVLKKPS